METNKRKAEESESDEARKEDEAYGREDEEEEDDDEGEDEVEGEDEGDKDEEEAAANDDVEKNDNGDDDVLSENVRSLIGPFSKEKLVDLLENLTSEDPSILPKIEKFADEDITHRKLFVRGLGGEISSDELKDVFLKFGEIEECTIIQDKQTGKSRGYGFVTYKQRDSAHQALKNPSKKIRGRITWCQLAAGGPTTTVQGNSADDPAPRKIYVGNVPVDLSADKILKFFLQYGAIEEGPLGYDKKTGKSKGFALFIYKTVDSAKKALKEPGKSIDGHQVYCKLALEGQKQKASTYLHSGSGDSAASHAPGIIGSAPSTYATLPGALSLGQGILNQHNLAAMGSAQGLLMGSNTGLLSYHSSLQQQMPSTLMPYCPTPLSSTVTMHSSQGTRPSQVSLAAYGLHDTSVYGSQMDGYQSVSSRQAALPRKGTKKSSKRTKAA